MSFFVTKTVRSKSSDWLTFKWQHTETVWAQTCTISKPRQESEAVHQTTNKLRSSTTRLTSMRSFGTEIPTDYSITNSKTSSVPTLQQLGAHNWREIIISWSAWCLTSVCQKIIRICYPSCTNRDNTGFIIHDLCTNQTERSMKNTTTSTKRGW